MLRCGIISEQHREKKEDKAKKSNGADKEGPAEEAAEDEAPEDEDDEDDDVEWLADTSEEAIRRRAQEQLTAATVAMVHAPVVEDDTQEAPEAKAPEPVTPAPAEEEESSEEEEEDLVEELRDAANTLSAEKVALALSKIDIEGGPIGRMQLLYEALFGGPGKALPERVSQHAELLKLHAGSAMEQLAQLLALEHLLVAVLPDRLQEVCWYRVYREYAYVGVPTGGVGAQGAVRAGDCEWGGDDGLEQKGWRGPQHRHQA